MIPDVKSGAHRQAAIAGSGIQDLDLLVKDSTLGGILRVTTSTPQQRGALGRIPCSETDAGNSTRVVVINEAMAKRYWKSEDPIGQVITIGKGLGPLNSSNSTTKSPPA